MTKQTHKRSSTYNKRNVDCNYTRRPFLTGLLTTVPKLDNRLCLGNGEEAVGHGDGYDQQTGHFGHLCPYQGDTYPVTREFHSQCFTLKNAPALGKDLLHMEHDLAPPTHGDV